jgi:hypothetical protein
MNGTVLPPTPDAPSSSRPILRDLPLAARLVLTAFLLSVGIGYLSALIQLHFKHTRGGDLLPTGGDAVRIFHGVSDDRSPPRIAALIDAAPNVDFGKNSMRAAFTREKADKGVWARDLGEAGTSRGGNAAQAEATLLSMRETERKAVLAWVRAGADQKAHDADAFPLPDDLKKEPLLPSLKNADGSFKLRTALGARCVWCHKPGSQSPPLGQADGGQFASVYDHLKPYAATKAGEPEMSLTSLAQTTHVHLLGFSMLYGLTGLILAFSSLPWLLRLVLCPLPLVMQVADIACWWLARLDKPAGPIFAHVIPITGTFVAAGLFLHIILSVFDMYSTVGKLVLALSFAAVGAGGYVIVKPIVEKAVAREKEDAAKEKEGGADGRGAVTPPQPRIAVLLSADPGLEFGSASMRAAFTREKADKGVWNADKKEAGKLPEGKADPEALLLSMRETERKAVLAWVRAGADQKAHDADAFPLPDDLKKEPLLPSLKNADGSFKLRTALGARCVWCHKEGSQEPALGEANRDGDLLTVYDHLKPYATLKGDK